jgi:hypothetical protein
VQDEIKAVQVAVMGSEVQVARARAAVLASLTLQQSLKDRHAAALASLRACRSKTTGPLPAVGPIGATDRPPERMVAMSALGQHTAALPPLALQSADAACIPNAALCCTSRCAPSVFAPRKYGYRPISSFQVLRPIPLAAIAAHAAAHSAIAGTQSLLTELGRHTLAYQTTHAAHCGREPHEVCWFIQLPYRADKSPAGCPLSFSTQMGSSACFASFILFYHVNSLHAALLTAEADVLENAAQSLGEGPI